MTKIDNFAGQVGEDEVDYINEGGWILFRGEFLPAESPHLGLSETDPEVRQFFFTIPEGQHMGSYMADLRLQVCFSSLGYSMCLRSSGP